MKLILSSGFAANRMFKLKILNSLIQQSQFFFKGIPVTEWYIDQIQRYIIRNSYTMGCPPVYGDNPRALASGLSYVQVDKHGITILYTYISVDLAHHEIFCTKVGKGDINVVLLGNFYHPDNMMVPLLFTFWEVSYRPPDKMAYLKIIFLISEPKHMFWVLKRTLDEMVLLSTQNTCLN